MQANQEILIESDPSFYMRFYRVKLNLLKFKIYIHLCRYLNIEVLSPRIEDGFNSVRPITPHEV